MTAICVKCHKNIPDSFHDFGDECECRDWRKVAEDNNWMVRINGKVYNYTSGLKIKRVKIMDEIKLNGIKYIKAKGVKKELILSEKQFDLPFEVGKSYFIRTVTYHLIGRVKKIVGKFLILEGASWIGDSGRFQQAIKDGRLSEVEIVGHAIVNTDSITDSFNWTYDLPTKQK